MLSRGHWGVFPSTGITLVLVSDEKGRRVFKSEGPAAAHPAEGDDFSFAASSKHSAAAAGPCFALGEPRWGLPAPAISSCLSPGLPLCEQSCADPFPLLRYTPCPHARGRNWDRDVQHPGWWGDRSQVPASLLPGKSNMEQKPSKLPLKLLHHTAGEIWLWEGKRLQEGRRILPGISLWAGDGEMELLYAAKPVQAPGKAHLGTAR